MHREQLSCEKSGLSVWRLVAGALLGGVLVVGLLWSAGAAFAQGRPSSHKKAASGTAAVRSKPEAADSKGKSRDPEATLAFVARHVPELAALLRRLEQIDPKQYRRALSELNRQRRRLENWRRRNPKRYRLELAAWKAQQQAQLLAARLAMDPENAQLKQQLREAIRQQIENRRKWLEMERAQVQKRLEQIDKSLRRWSDPQTLERMYRSLLNSAGKGKSRDKGKKPRGRSPKAAPSQAKSKSSS